MATTRATRALRRPAMIRAMAPPMETPRKVASRRSRTSTPHRAHKEICVVLRFRDVRITVTGVIERADREMFHQIRYHFLEKIELRAQGMEQRFGPALALMQRSLWPPTSMYLIGTA